MLSDEEKKAIKEVKHFKELTRYWQEEEYEEKEIAGYITTVLNLIKKQSKEIEELKEDNQRYKRIASQKLDDIEKFRKNECEHRCIRNAEVLELKEYYQENYTPNDKIKAKIEEVEKIIKEDREELNFGKTLRDDILQGIAYKIDFNTRLKNILESLLEKE